MENTANRITLTGTLASLPEYSHQNHERKFFRFLLSVDRLSGTEDLLPVLEVVKSRRLRVPKNYRVVEEINYYSDMTGFTRYMKAIRIGGEDYGEGKPHEQYFDGEG